MKKAADLLQPFFVLGCDAGPVYPMLCSDDYLFLALLRAQKCRFCAPPPQPSTFIVISGAGRASYDSHQARNRRLRAMNAPVAGLQTLDGRVSGPGRPFLFLTHDVWGDKKPYLYAGFWRRWSYMSGQLPWALKAGVRKKTANGLSRKGRGY